MINLMISLLIILLIVAAIYWVFTLILPHIPQPVQWVAQVIFALFCLAMILTLFLGYWSFPFAGHPLLR